MNLKFQVFSRENVSQLLCKEKLPCASRCSKQALKVFKGQPPANTLQVDLLCCLLNIFKDTITIHVCFVNGWRGLTPAGS